MHECTYLNGGKLEELNLACCEVLTILVERAGYKERYGRLVRDAERTYKGMSVTL